MNGSRGLTLAPFCMVSVLVQLCSSVAASRTGAVCSSSMDCSLNGDCVGGKCDCDPAWSGSDTCSVMAFEPLDKDHMPGYYNATESSWGGFPIKGADGAFRLVHAQMANHCPLGSWTSNSIVGLSKSITGQVEGPYAFEKELLPPFAHNPTIRRAVDGTFIIYFIGGWATAASKCNGGGDHSAVFPSYFGSGAGVGKTGSGAEEAGEGTCNGQGWAKSCGPDMPGPSKDCCGPANATYKGNAGCGIAIASSKSLDGPWKVQPLVIEDQFDSDNVYCAHTNPSPVFLHNGSVVVAFNAGFCNGHLETIGLAHADTWEGPYRLFEKNAVLKNPDGSPHHCEDPYLWHDARGFHLITHNQQGPQGGSSYGYSSDGHNWTLSRDTPHTCTLTYTDGTSATASGCGNRPQIVWSGASAEGGIDGGDGGGPDQGGSPLWLVNGATSAKPRAGKGTWTLFRKLKTSK